jgi:hypothetical protein
MFEEKREKVYISFKGIRAYFKAAHMNEGFDDAKFIKRVSWRILYQY